jgi:hypothetical protein
VDTIYGAEVPVQVNNADGSTSYALGTRFVAQQDCYAISGRWYFPTTIPHASIRVKVGIYRNLDTSLLGSVEFPLAATLGAWNEVPFSSPIALVSGVAYTVVIWTPLRYVARGSYPWPVTSAPDGLVKTDDAGAGRFTAAGDITFPTSNGNSSYFADLVTSLTASEDNAVSAAITLPALQAAGQLGAVSTVSAPVSLPALQAAAVLAARSALSAALALPALDMSALLAPDVPDTSSPTAEITTSTRTAIIATITRERVITTGTGGPNGA